MIKIALFFVLDAIIYILLKNHMPLDVLNVFSLLVFTVLIVSVIKKETKTKHVFFLLLASYLIKFGYMFFDIYANGTFMLIKNTIDSAGFHRVALSILNGTESIIGAEKGNFSVLLYFFYRVFGVNKVMIQYLNIVLFSLSQVFFIRITYLIGLDERKAFFPILLICLFPASFLFIPMLMRESLLIFLIVLTIYFFIKWYKNGNWINSVMTVIILLIASVFHMGFLAWIPVYIFFVIFLNRKEGRLVFKLKSVLITVLMIGSLGIAAFVFQNIFLEKLSTMGPLSLETFYRYLELSPGGSAYLVNLDYNSIWHILLYAPARIFYFLFSPFPWDWRGFMDGFVFIFDSIFYLAFIAVLIPIYRKTEKKNRLLLVVFILQYFVFVFFFSHGSYTTGTAVRHRFKSMFLIAAIYIISGDGDPFGISRFIGKVLKITEARVQGSNENREISTFYEFIMSRVLLKVLEFKPFSKMNDKTYLKLRYFIRLKYMPDLDNPVKYNEKLQWLKLHDRNPIYPILADKLRVRDYIEQKVGKEYLVPLLGVWEKPSQIDFDSLPEQFVLKCNHDSGSAIVVKSKNLIDKEKIVSHFKKALSKDYCLKTREWPYKNIEPRILCEVYLNDGSAMGLRDYKIFCFNGKAEFIRVTYQGKKRDLRSEFDTNWNLISETIKFFNDGTVVEKPRRLDEMIQVAEKLAKGLIHIRVDFYEVYDRLYVGELTLYYGSGMNWFRFPAHEKRLGDLMDISKIKYNEEKLN